MPGSVRLSIPKCRCVRSLGLFQIEAYCLEPGIKEKIEDIVREIQALGTQDCNGM